MTFFVLTKIFASAVTGMLGIPIGILPSIFLFRGLANGVDDSEATKRYYALTLWGRHAVRLDPDKHDCLVVHNGSVRLGACFRRTNTP